MTTRVRSSIMWAASSEFGAYRICEQRRFRRACASAQSRQNLRCSLIQAVSQEEPSDRKPDPWPLWMAGHAQLKLVMTECSKTQIRLMRLMYIHATRIYEYVPRVACLMLYSFNSISSETTIIILRFRTDRSGKTVQTQIRLSDQGLHCLQFPLHFLIFWSHYSTVKPPCSNFRVITANFWVSEFLGFLRYKPWALISLAFRIDQDACAEPSSTEIWTSSGKLGLFQKKDNFAYFSIKTCCGYSLESPRRTY